jgi:hypothetical protein
MQAKLRDTLKIMYSVRSLSTECRLNRMLRIRLLPKKYLIFGDNFECDKIDKFVN